MEVSGACFTDLVPRPPEAAEIGKGLVDAVKACGAQLNNKHSHQFRTVFLKGLESCSSSTSHTDVLTFGPNQMLFGKLRPGPLNFSRLNLSPVLRSRTFEVNGHRMPSESI